MASHNLRANPPKKIGGLQSGRKKADGSNSKSIHLVLDNASYTRLIWLQGALKASSFTEVLRRALDAYEIFEPEGLALQSNGENDDTIASSPKAGVKHLYVDISEEMKKHLDDEKSKNGLAYKATISRALCVLMQIVRERNALVNALKGGVHDKEENCIGDPDLDRTRAKLLATL